MLDPLTMARMFDPTYGDKTAAPSPEPEAPGPSPPEEYLLNDEEREIRDRAQKYSHGPARLQSTAYWIADVDVPALLASLMAARGRANALEMTTREQTDLIIEARQEAQQQRERADKAEGERDEARQQAERLRDGQVYIAGLHIAAQEQIEQLRAALEAQKRHCFRDSGGDDSCHCDEIEDALAQCAAPDAGKEGQEAGSEALGSSSDRELGTRIVFALRGVVAEVDRRAGGHPLLFRQAMQEVLAEAEMEARAGEGGKG